MTEGLKHDKAEIRGRAVQTLGKIGADAVPVLVDALATAYKRRPTAAEEVMVEVNPDTKEQLLSQANEWGQISWSNGGSHASDSHVGQMLQLIVATREYQFA